MLLDIAPLTGALYNLGSGSWLAWLQYCGLRKLVAPIACATDFGPAVMQPDVLYAPVSPARPSPRNPRT